MHKCLTILLIALLTVSCGQDEAGSSGAIYTSGTIKVFPDSIVIGGKNPEVILAKDMAPAEISGQILLPGFTSQQNIGNILWRKSIRNITACDTPITTDDIFLSLAILRPDLSMDALRAATHDGKIVRTGYPVVMDNLMWADAAWQIYCVTGSKKWLREAYAVLNSTLTAERKISTAGNNLIHGIPAYLTPATNHYPGWMKPSDLYMSISAGVNIAHLRTIEVMALMTRELEMKVSEEHSRTAKKIRDAVNDHFWMPSQSSYGQYLYGRYYPLLSSVNDNVANALAVIFGAATPEMGDALMASRPALPTGMPLTYPLITAVNNDGIIPFTQALQGWGAARTSSENAMLGAIAALWLMGKDLPVRSEWPALVIKGLFGMEFTPEGLSFSPVIPAKFDGKKSLYGIHYRDCTLDIALSGTGNRIASFSIDSVSHARPLIPSGLKGHHQVEIIMVGNRIESPRPAIAEPAYIPAAPEPHWTANRNMSLPEGHNGLRYNIYQDGILTSTIKGGRYTVNDETTVTSITSVDRNGAESFADTPHISTSYGDRICIPASSITPRRAPLHLIHDRETAGKYIELAGRHNTRITFYVNAPSDGDYFLSIDYTNGSDRTAMRQVEAEGTYAGILVCPPVAPNDWITTAPSSTVTVRLRQGPNQIALTYINTTILLHSINLLRKNR